MPRKPARKYVVIYRSESREDWERDGWQVTQPEPLADARQKKVCLEEGGFYCLGPEREDIQAAIGVPDTFDSDDPIPGGDDL